MFLYNCFKNTNDDEYPMFSTISAVFAKSSIFWSTYIYILTNKSIKSKMILTGSIKQSSQNNSMQYVHYNKSEINDQTDSKRITILKKHKYSSTIIVV